MAKDKKVTRKQEIVTKGWNLALRQVSLAPEMRQARRLAKSVAAHKSESTRLAGKKILIPTIRDWSAHVHLEALLGHYLSNEGAQVRHLSCGGGLEICDRANSWEAPPMPCKSCSRYVQKSLNAHGSNVSFLSTGWGNSTWPEIDDISIADLSAVEFMGYPLGKMVEVPVKWFLLAETLSNDPLAGQTFRSFLRSSRRVLESVLADIERDPPDQVVLLNGLFMFESVIWEVCRRKGIPVVSYERAFIIDTFVFAHDRVSSFYEIDDVWEQFKQTHLQANDETTLDEYLTDRRIGLRTTDDYWARVDDLRLRSLESGRRAVLFTNLVWDSAVLGQDVAFDSIVDWIVAAIEKFRSLPENELVIRIHPAEIKLSGRESRERMLDALLLKVPELPRNVFVIPAEDNVSSYQLMDDADFGLVYSSTTGLEMVLAGKPVIVAAKTHYRGKGFTVDVSSASEFEEAVDQLIANPSRPDTELARRYATLFFFKTPYFGMGVHEPMRGLVEFDSTDYARLRHGGRGDVERFISAVAEGISFNSPTSKSG